jgi:hypothetical protein
VRPLVGLALLAACTPAACTPANTGAGGASFRLYAGEPGQLYELRAPSEEVAGDTAAPIDTAPSDTAPSDTSPGDTAAPVSTGPTRWLRVDDAAWTLTEGDDVDTATLVATWALQLDGGLTVDDTALLPDTVRAGASVGTATVRAIAPWETVYGTFADAAEVEVTGDGPWAGTHVFAKGVGPVFLTLRAAEGASAPWETAWYEQPPS